MWTKQSFRQSQCPPRLIADLTVKLAHDFPQNVQKVAAQIVVIYSSKDAIQVVYWLNEEVDGV